MTIIFVEKKHDTGRLRTNGSRVRSSDETVSRQKGILGTSRGLRVLTTRPTLIHMVGRNLALNSNRNVDELTVKSPCAE